MIDTRHIALFVKAFDLRQRGGLRVAGYLSSLRAGVRGGTLMIHAWEKL